MKQAMRKGLISLITGAATVASPMAFAAQDTGGMRYTSAAEGFYASIRTEFTSSDGTEDSGSHIDDVTSRFGVQGSNDLGGGLEGFYRYEVSTGVDNGDELKARLRYVGLRGGFGDIRFGTIWDDTYNFVTSKTDLTQNDTGGNAWYFRINNAIQYNTPDLNGFKASLRTTLRNEKADASCSADPTAAGNDKLEANAARTAAEVVDGTAYSITTCANAVAEDDNDLNSWALSAQYSVQGFNVAATYENIADALDEVDVVTGLGGDDAIGGTGDNADTFDTRSEDDHTRWAIGASYSQDNWLVASWYGVAEARTASDFDLGANDAVGGAGENEDTPGVIHDEDEETFSLGAQVSVDKVVVYGVFDSKDNVGGVKGVEDTQSAVGVQYNLGAQSRVWIEYISPDKDSEDDEDDFVNIGLRHDF